MKIYPFPFAYLHSKADIAQYEMTKDNDVFMIKLYLMSLIKIVSAKIMKMYNIKGQPHFFQER